ncbi:thermonuclease family protein [Rubrivivax gelatinosus]|uniref:thermonuclease family protein n=1 Tax=Rubrivivax gelatinosus TaxID=28068 RepID=UPI001A2B0DC0|nr:thermonuclease family protein [Rubrivivax gelatinosus]MBG6083122.1 endonuclease YncB(thermonuclease family) [Rubrivivax gelatinosus]
MDDGDTVGLLTGGLQQVKIRLSSIDAPESSHTNKQVGRIGQPYSTNSRRALEALVKGKAVEASCPDTDRYGRKVCFLFAEGVAVNAEMVRQGWAWANTSSKGRYLRDKSMVQLQEQAQRARIGLWAGESPIPPWEWRNACWGQGNCGATHTPAAAR